MNVDDLPGLYFLDTNVLVYSFDKSVPGKQVIAQGLIKRALHSQQGVISTQVIQEFLNVALRRFATPLTVSEGREYLTSVLTPLCQHFPTIGFYNLALLIREETGYSFYDALILTAAIEMGCGTLLSEDLQDGRIVRGVMIRNPFI